MKHRIIIVTVMLMAFLGQIAAASVVTCSMSKDSEISFETSNDEHSDHAMHNSHHTEDNTHHSIASDTNSIDNCCAQPGDCSMSGCMSLALAFEFHSSVSGHLTLKVEEGLQPALNYSPNSLYRPPASA